MSSKTETGIVDKVYEIDPPPRLEGGGQMHIIVFFPDNKILKCSQD